MNETGVIMKNIDNIFAKSIKSAEDEIRLEEPVMEEDSKDAGDTEYREDNAPLPASQIIENSVRKVVEPLHSVIDILGQNIAKFPWNQEIKDARNKLVTCDANLGVLNKTLRNFKVV